MVVLDMASIPPRNKQFIPVQPKHLPTKTPVSSMANTMDMAAMTGAMPIFSIFLNENSSPSAKSRNTTPMSAHMCTSERSTTEGV